MSYSVDKQLLHKLKLWCDRQERCHSELREKLFKEKVYGALAEEYIATLILDNYVNESRFAKAYVSGKFRIKRWGRNKIKQNLKFKRVSEYCIKEGLLEIDSAEYQKTVEILIEKKLKDYSPEKNLYVLKSKISKYIMGRGFEADLVWRILNERITS